MSQTSRSNREDLFVQTSRQTNAAAEEKKSELARHVESDEEDDRNPLQLEHVVGFNASLPSSVLMINGTENLYVRSMDRLVAIENLNEPSQQKVLRGHDMQVTTLAISPSGNLIASGQIGTKNFKGYAAPIFVWETYTRRRIAVLRGLSQKVNLISFSTDEKFVCGCGEDCVLYVWELATGEVIFGKQNPSPVSFLRWVEHSVHNRKITHELVYGVGSQVFQGMFFFDQERVQWSLKVTAYLMPPSGGLVRFYNCCDISPNKDYIYVGSTGAEMMIYCRATKPVFRGAIPVLTHGIRSILALPDGDVICGGGNGVLKRLRGADLVWEAVGQTEYTGELLSLSLTANATEILVGTSEGTVHRCATHNLRLGTVISSCHLSAVRCIAFGSRSEQFVSGSAGGELRVWDLADYACQAYLKIPKAGSVLSAFIVDPVEGVSNSNSAVVASGWEDGGIRCHDIETLNRQIWFIPNAHRGGVTSIAVHCSSAIQYMISGGADGVVRIWRLSNRELITQFSEHSKTVTKVLIDVQKPNLVHSTSLDMSVLSYDLKSQRRTVSHLVQHGSFTDMTQRHDSEQELITCDIMGRLLFWDCDVRDPVSTIQDPSGGNLNRCAVSPTGRFIAFAGQDTALKVMDIKTSSMVGLGSGHSAPVTSLSWTPDERQIVTGGDDSCICVWNLYV